MKRKTVRESIWFKRVKYAKLEPNQYLCKAVGCRIGDAYVEGSSICQICSDLEDDEFFEFWGNPNYHTYVPI